MWLLRQKEHEKEREKEREEGSKGEVCEKGGREKLHYPHGHLDLSREGWPRGLKGTIAFTRSTSWILRRETCKLQITTLSEALW